MTDSFHISTETTVSKIVASTTQCLLKSVDDALISSISSTAGSPAHKWFSRNLISGQSGLETILKSHLSGSKFYILVSAPLSKAALQLDTITQYILALWFQKSFNIPVVMQLCDDTLFYSNTDMKYEAAQTFALERSKDILALGFLPEKTFIFQNTKYIQHLYRVLCEVNTAITTQSVITFESLTQTDNVGLLSTYSLPVAACFAPSFSSLFPATLPCLVLSTPRQVPQFQLAQRVASQLGLIAPAILEIAQLPALGGPSAAIH